VLEHLATHFQTGLAQLTDPQQAPLHLLALVSAAVAGALVVVSAFVKTMIPLRWLAVGSNIGFIVYGLAHPSLLMVLLHGVLLPVNLWRVVQMRQLTRRVMAVAADPQQVGLWLRPYMRSRQHRPGHVLFERGAVADRMYLLTDGAVDLPDVNQSLGPGDLFGEIAFFAPDGRRSSRAVCRTRCTVLSIDRDIFLQLVHQNPAFGLQLLHLVTARLSRDLQRARGAAASAGARGADNPTLPE
jgi:hypothetical protein